MSEFKFISQLPKSEKVDADERHFLNGMMLTRHHVFCCYNKCGLESAREVNNLRYAGHDISESQNIGLDYELIFFDAFRKELNLIPALDCGDHTDFVGFFKGEYLKIDVTGNLSEKQKCWENYRDDPNHLVAVYDKDKNEWSYYIADSAKQELVLRR